MPRALKACPTCGTPTRTTPCTPCTPPRTGQPPGTHTATRTARGYDNDWLRLRNQAIQRQPWCGWPEGCDYPITPSNPLTGEHLTPISQAPERRLDPTNVIVLCLKHNSQRRRLPTPTTPDTPTSHG